MTTRRKQRQRKARRPRDVNVNEAALGRYNSYGTPKFVQRGFYVDEPFRCRDCGKDEIWTAWQQKWWYEVAKGYVYSSAVRCRGCRRKDRERRGKA